MMKMIKLLPAISSLTLGTVLAAMPAFQELDANKDNVLSRQELDTVLVGIDFTEADKNNDGSLEAEEYNLLIKKLRSLPILAGNPEYYLIGGNSPDNPVFHKLDKEQIVEPHIPWDGLEKPYNEMHRIVRQDEDKAIPMVSITETIPDSTGIHKPSFNRWFFVFPSENSRL